MKTLALLVILMLLPVTTGCSGKANEGINRDKDKPRPEPKAARTHLERHKGALLEDTSQETHPLAWVGCLEIVRG